MLRDEPFSVLKNSGWLNFSGMRGRLCDMQKQGWAFAINEAWDARFGEHELELAGRHPQGNIELLARAPNPLRSITRSSYALIELEFHTYVVAPRIQVATRVPTMRAMKWGAFDAEDMTYDQMGVRDLFELGALAFFKPVEPAKEIYVPEKELWTVEKHLDAIIEMQKPYQDELRRKHLDEQRKKKLNEGCETRAVASLIAV